MKLNEKLVKILLVIAATITIVSVFIFIYSSPELNINYELDTDKFNHLGAFLGGSVGILVSFAGTILVYLSLNHQRKDIQQNRKALSLQIDELKNQREELELTREVFKQQSLTSELQRFENTFFNLIQLMQENKNKIQINKFPESKEVIHSAEAIILIMNNIRRDLHIAFDKSPNPTLNEKLKLLEDVCDKNRFFKTVKYFNTFQVIIEYIENHNPINKKFYYKIITAQLQQLDYILFGYYCVLNKKETTVILGSKILDRLKEKNFVDKTLFDFLMEA